MITQGRASAPGSGRGSKPSGTRKTGVAGLILFSMPIAFLVGVLVSDDLQRFMFGAILLTLGTGFLGRAVAGLLARQRPDTLDDVVSDQTHRSDFRPVQGLVSLVLAALAVTGVYVWLFGSQRPTSIPILVMAVATVALVTILVHDLFDPLGRNSIYRFLLKSSAEKRSA